MTNFKNSLDFGLKDINPNKLPIEIIKEGAFGGNKYGVKCGTSLRFLENKG